MSLLLNESNDSAFFIMTGISFHNVAPLKAIDFCVKLKLHLGRNTFPATADLA